jgi:hypothetical protein
MIEAIVVKGVVVIMLIIKKLQFVGLVLLALGWFEYLSAASEGNNYKRYIHPGWYDKVSFEPVNSKFYKTKMRFLTGAQEKSIQYKLEQSLPAGKYYFFMHSYYVGPKPRGYKDPATFKINLNGSSGTIFWPDAKVQKRGWLKTEILTQRSGDLLEVKILPSKAAVKYDIIANLFYLTSDPVDVATSREFILASAMKNIESGQSDRFKKTKNYLGNGGFEVGWGHGWRFMNGNTGHAINHKYWLTGNTPQGEHALLVPDKSRLQSNLINLKKGNYILSAMVRKSSNDTFKLQLWTYEDVRKYKFKKGYTQSYKANEDWKQFDFKLNVREGRYVVAITGGVDVDAIQLSQGVNLVPFMQRKPVEIGMTTNKIGRAYRYKEEKKAVLRVATLQKDITNANIWYRIVDFNGNVVRKTHKSVLLREGKYSESIDLSVNKSGIFRVDMGLVGEDNKVQEEMTYTVHLDLSDNYFSNPGFIGFYDALGEDKVPVLITAGMNVTNAINSNPSGSWRKLQPKKDVYFWQDKYYEFGKNAGMEMFILLDPRHFPSWVKKAKQSNTVRLRPENMDDWGDFVYQAAKHYKQFGVKGYELLDDQDHYYSTEDHLEYVKYAYKNIKKADPNALVITWPWMSKETLTTASSGEKDEIYKTLKEHSDIFFQAGSNIAKKYERKMWGYNFSTSYSMYQNHTVIPSFSAPHYSRSYYKDKSARTVALDLGRIAKYGASRFFRYEAHLANNHKSIFDYDGVLLPVGTAYSILEHYIRGKVYVCSINDINGLSIHSFKGDKTHTYIFWTQGGAVYNGEMPSVGIRFSVNDFMGNSVKLKDSPQGVLVRLDKYPHYLTVDNKDVNKFESMLAEIKLRVLKPPFSVMLETTENEMVPQLKIEFNNSSEKTSNVQVRVAGKSSLITLLHPEISIKKWLIKLVPGKSDRVTIPIQYAGRSIDGNLSIITDVGAGENVWNIPLKVYTVAKVTKNFSLAKETLKYFPRLDHYGQEVKIFHEGKVADIKLHSGLSNEFLYLWFNVSNKHSRSNLLDGIVNELKLYFDFDPTGNKYLRLNEKKSGFLTINLNQSLSSMPVMKFREEQVQVDVFIDTPNAMSKDIQIKIPRAKILRTFKGNKHGMIGFNFALHAGFQSETFYEAWASWGGQNSDYPASFNYLSFEFSQQ